MMNRSLPVAAAIAALLPATLCSFQAEALGQDRYEKFMRKGERYVRRNRYAKALDAFARAVREDPYGMDAYFNAGNIARHLKKCGEALLYFHGFLYLSTGTEDDAYARKSIKACAKAAGAVGLSITSEPRGAEVFLDGAIVGRTPLADAAIAPGTYEAELRHPDCEPESWKLEVKPGGPVLVEKKLKLKPAFGYLKVVVEPSDGVHVFLDEKEIGVTPLKDEVKLKTGKYLLTLRKQGYDKWIRYVTIKKDRTYTLRATMEKTPQEPPSAPAEPKGRGETDGG